MSKIVSAAISILLLFLADRVAMHWKHIHGEGSRDESKAGSMHSIEARRALGPQNILSGNFRTDDMVETIKL